MKYLFTSLLLSISLSYSFSQHINATKYTKGATKSEVLKIQGDPDIINESDVLNESIWYYGSSSLRFKNGKLTEYSNIGKNLKVTLMENTNSKEDGLKNPFSMTQEEIDEKQKNIPDLLDITGASGGSGRSASFPEKYREMANEYNLSPFASPSQEELDRMLLVYRLKKCSKWAIIPILILGIYYLRSIKNNRNKHSETLHLKERYKELIRAFDDYDLYNKPIVLIDELNMFKMAWVGQTIKSDFWLNEVNRTLIVKYTLEYNTENLFKKGVRVKELPVINQELNWKFDIDKMGQIEMYSIISTDLKAKMDKV